MLNTAYGPRSVFRFEDAPRMLFFQREPAAVEREEEQVGR
jgi:hypothetical protein